MKAVGSNTYSSSLKGNVYFAIRGKKQWQNNLGIFCRFGHYFGLVGKIDTTSHTRDCSCILCPNVENFCPNNGQFFSVEDATASPCCTLMLQNVFNFNNTRPWPIKNSSVAHRLRNPELNDII